MSNTTIFAPRPGAARAPEKSRSRVKVEARYAFRNGDHELRLACPQVSRRVAQAFRGDAAEFALAVEGPIILIGCRFGDVIPWTFARYCWHMEPRGDRSPPPAAGSAVERRAAIDITLTQQGDPAPALTRVATVSLEFTRALHEAIRDQARLMFDPREFARAEADLSRHFPLPEGLVLRAVARSMASL